MGQCFRTLVSIFFVAGVLYVNPVFASVQTEPGAQVSTAKKQVWTSEDTEVLRAVVELETRGSKKTDFALHSHTDFDLDPRSALSRKREKVPADLWSAAIVRNAEIFSLKGTKAESVLPLVDKFSTVDGFEVIGPVVIQISLPGYAKDKKSCFVYVQSIYGLQSSSWFLYKGTKKHGKWELLCLGGLVS